MTKLSSVGLALLFGAAACHVIAVLRRSEPQAGWRHWWAGAWAPREEFSPTGWRWALSARMLTGLGLLLYVLGQQRSLGGQ